jgi:hypothetical protein
MSITFCKLCKNPALLQDSHIIPASMHKVLKDKSGKNISFHLPGDLKMKNQRDLKEYMLCKECEELFSKFENSVNILKPLWKSTAEGKNPHTIPAKSVTSILQLAHSVFWRASVSKKIHNYKLPAADEELLRLALLNNSPIEPPRFAVRLDFFTYLRSIGSSNMMQSPFTHNAFPDSTYSAFVSLGIIFSMQSPAASEILGAGPYLSLGESYKISRAPILIEYPCVLILDEMQKIAKSSLKKPT